MATFNDNVCVTFSSEAREQLRLVQVHIDNARSWVDAGTVKLSDKLVAEGLIDGEYQHYRDKLDSFRETHLDYIRDMEDSFLFGLIRIMVGSDYDGDVRIVRDTFHGSGSSLSFEWYHVKSGLHGGFIYRQQGDMPYGSWSIHT